MRVEVLRIPWIGPSMNVIWAGKHWSLRKRIADEAHWAVHAVARDLVMFAAPVRLEFTPKHKGRPYDPSNYAVTVKAIEDGLVMSGILPGDTGDKIKSVTIHAPEKLRAEQSYMLVKISEVQDV